MSAKEAFQSITENTRLPFKVILPLLVAIIGASAWLHSAIVDIKVTRAKSWTIQNQDYFVTQLRAANTNLYIPSVAEALRHEKEAVR